MGPGNRDLKGPQEGKSHLRLQPQDSPSWREVTGLGTEAEGCQSLSEDMAEGGETTERKRERTTLIRQI